jgi:hypothetical protein
VISRSEADRLTARLRRPVVDARLPVASVAPGRCRRPGEGVAEVADVLGLTATELQAQLKGGKNLKEIDAAKGVPYATVTAAALSPVKARLAAAVAAGTIKQARAERILARLEQNLADGRLRNERPAPAATPDD